MRGHNALVILFCLLAVTVSVRGQDPAPVPPVDTRPLLAHWLSVDTRYPVDVTRFARGDNPRPYHQMIVNSVRDYRLALRWADAQSDLDVNRVFATGYSMGAQMTLLLAALEPRVSSVLAMVPPYVGRQDSPVAPRHHVAGIDAARVLLIAASNDPYSSVAQTRQVFDGVASAAKEVMFFDSQHVLPPAYLAAATGFIDRQVSGERQ